MYGPGWKCAWVVWATAVITCQRVNASISHIDRVTFGAMSTRTTTTGERLPDEDEGKKTRTAFHEKRASKQRVGIWTAPFGSRSASSAYAPRQAAAKHPCFKERESDEVYCLTRPQAKKHVCVRVCVGGWGRRTFALGKVTVNKEVRERGLFIAWRVVKQK